MKGAWRIHSIAVGLGLLVGCEDPGGMSGPDAGVPPRCNPAASFGRQTDVQGLNTNANEEQATLSPDELTIYFSRDDGNGAYDIYQATRTSKTASFSGAIPVPGVNTMAEDREPRVTADGLAIFATTRATPSGLFRVASATRASKDVPFGPLQPVPQVNGTTNDSDPFICRWTCSLLLVRPRRELRAVSQHADRRCVFATRARPGHEARDGIHGGHAGTVGRRAHDVLRLQPAKPG